MKITTGIIIMMTFLMAIPARFRYERQERGGLWSTITSWFGWLWRGNGHSEKYPLKRPDRRKQPPRRRRADENLKDRSEECLVVTGSSTESNTSLCAIRPTRDLTVRKRGLEPLHREKIEEETRVFLQYLRANGRDNEVEKFVRKSKNVSGQYQDALKHFRDFLEHATKKLDRLEKERENPEYELPGRYRREEEESRALGECQCLHCRLKRKGFFGNDTTTNWVAEYEDYIRRRRTGSEGIKFIYGEYDDNWTD